jgi:DNA-binding MarR family transcriptional regulator
MDTGAKSELLFGRYQALAIYSTIARLPKPEFTTGQLAHATGYPVAACSKELARLERLGVLTRRSRRGDFERHDPNVFWEVVDKLADAWAGEA